MNIKNIIIIWLPIAVVSTAFCALTFASVQQALRQGLNDPQIQMAEDGAFALDQGAAVASILSTPTIEMSRSLAPFIVIFDNNGKPVASTGMLNGYLPDYPKAALESSKQSGENQVTWQPDPNVRIASVVVPYKDGFVMAGRNMREVEQREQGTENLAIMTWVLTLITTLIVIAAVELFLANHKNEGR